MSRKPEAERPPVPVSLPPERRLAAAVERYGERVVMQRALSLIAGYNEGADFLLYVGGEHARGLLDGAPVLFWPELWGTRTLLYVWDESLWNDEAQTLVRSTLNNTAWRVREMGAKLVVARQVKATRELAVMLGDEVARVRAAAATALGELGSLSDGDHIRALLKDPVIDVRRAAQRSLDSLRKRHPKATD